MNEKVSKCSCFCFILMAYCAFFCVCAEAATSYPPSDDTFIDQIGPNNTNGSSSSLVCRTYSGWNIYSLLKFDLSSVSSNAVVTSATLNLYYFHKWDGDPAGAAFDARRVLEDWDEDTATWNNRPSVAASETDSTTAPGSYDWMQWDVTSDVQAFVDGTYSNYGWQIKKSSGGTNEMTYFKSKDADESEYHPYLEIEIEVECSGQWGYHPGDANRDCRVDMEDLAIVSRHWLLSSDPDDPNSSQGEDSYIGAGFAFDGEDMEGPARVILLYDDLNADIVEPNDIILEYAGMPVNSGNELLTVIMTTDDVQAGQSVPVVLLKGIDIIVTAFRQGVFTQLAERPWYKCQNRECVMIHSLAGGRTACACQGYANDYCWYRIGGGAIWLSPYAQSAYGEIITECYNGDEWGNNEHNICMATAGGGVARLIAK